MADLLAQRAREPHDPAAVQPGQRTDPTGWTAEALRRRLEAVKDRLGWGETTGSARKWWEAFEAENANRVSLVLRLAEELLARNATITEFFLAYVYSNTDNIQANLHYLDYSRLKKDEERRKKEQGRDEPGPANAG
jgi:hypothetical protein